MGCVYVAIGKGGLLKVGRTISPFTRKSALAADFKRFGDLLDRFRSFDVIEACYSAESDLIRSVAATHKQYSGREWFESGDFDAAVALAERATDTWRKHTYSKKIPAEQMAWNAAVKAVRRAAWKADIAKRKAEYTERVLVGRELRALRRSEIAARQLLVTSV